MRGDSELVGARLAGVPILLPVVVLDAPLGAGEEPTSAERFEPQLASEAATNKTVATRQASRRLGGFERSSSPSGAGCRPNALQPFRPMASRIKRSHSMGC